MRRLLVVSAAVLALAAGVGVWWAWPAAPDAELDGVRVLTQDSRSDGSGSDANVSGVLVDVGGCVGLQQGEPGGDGPGTVLVIWPRGTEVEDGTVRTPGGIVARLGESIQGGGGYHALTSGLVDTEVPDECAAAARPDVAVLNGDG